LQAERTTDTQSQGTKTLLTAPQGGAAAPPLPFLHPINKDVFNALNIPCLEIAPPDAAKAIQGKPLAQILRDTPLASAEGDTAGICSTGVYSTAALFSDGKFIAMIERQDNKWSYRYVYARD
jgi:hypothetical protein